MDGLNDKGVPKYIFSNSKNQSLLYMKDVNKYNLTESESELIKENLDLLENMDEGEKKEIIEDLLGRPIELRMLHKFELTVMEIEKLKGKETILGKINGLDKQ